MRKIYFEHKEYKGLIFQYVGPLHYPDGRKVEDFVSVYCLNDLGLRAYKTHAYTAVAKRSLTPYRGPLPNGEPHKGPAATRRPPSPNERIERTNVAILRDGKEPQQASIFGDDKE